MLIKWGETCPSLGSDQCPCVLADFKTCPACSHLTGLPLCDCDWQGHCPYLEKQWSSHPADVAVGSEPQVVAARQSAPTVLELVVAVGDRSLYPYSEPGSAVRIGSANLPVETTALAMDSVPNKRLVLLAISLEEPRNSLLAQTNALWIDRRLGNILMGRETLARQEQSRVLLVAQGFWQAGLLPVARDLLARGCRLQAVLSSEGSGANFIAGRLQELGVAVQELRLLTAAIMAEILRREPYDVVVGLGNDHLQQWLGGSWAETKHPLVVTNDLVHYPMR